MIERYRARCLFADFLLFLAPFSLVFILLPRLFTHFFLFFLVSHQVSNHLPFQHLSITSLSDTPLHYEVQLRFSRSKLIFSLLDSFALQKIYITMFNACCTLHENMHCINNTGTSPTLSKRCTCTLAVAASKESGFFGGICAKPKPAFLLW